MYTSNNQVIFEEIYDENIQATEEEIAEYAIFLGIEPNDEPELMWIARQGVMAPLPKGWKPVQDPHGELYYFNFETGESIWDHPCDDDYKKLVIQERKVLLEKGKENYKPPPVENRSPTKGLSPSNTLRNSNKLAQSSNGISTTKSTSTISEVLNEKNQMKNKLRNDFALFDTRELGNVEFEEENDQKYKDNDDEDEDEESEPSWQKKSGSDESSDGFHKPVDFGIDKETSYKLDKLNVMLMVGKDSALNNNRASFDSAASAPTSARDGMDSPTRNYVKNVLGYNKDEDMDLKKSYEMSKLSSISEEYNNKQAKRTGSPIDHQKELKLFQESLEREFDQKRLELLESKDLRLKKLKEQIDKEILSINENESKKIQKDQEEKLKELREKMQINLEREQENLKKRHNEVLNNLQKEFENEKSLRKQKFDLQVSKYMKSGQSLDDLNTDEEKKEIAIYFEHIEKKYSDKLDERRKELQTKYDKKTQELDNELKKLYDEETEKKENEIRLAKEKNLRFESYDKQMEKILGEKIKEFKEKENREFEKIKQEYDIKIRSFKEKYKELEEKEFSYLENEYNKTKEKMQAEYNTKISSLENKLKSNHDVLKREEEDLKKRLDMIDQRRRNFDLEWNKLNEEEKRLDSKKENVISKIFSNKSNNDVADNTNTASYKNDELKMKYEIEKLKIEKSDLETKLQSMQKLLDNFYAHEPHENNSKHSKLNNSNVENYSNNNFTNENNDTDTEDSSKNSEQLISKIKALNNQSITHNNLKDSEDDSEINELVEHAKLKLKLKYYGAKKKAQFDFSNKSDTVDDSDLYDSSNENLDNKVSEQYVNNPSENLNQDISENKRYFIENLNKEKNALEMANELLNNYKHNLIKRKVKLEKAQMDLKRDEASNRQISPLKLEDRKLFLEKEELDLEQLGLNIKTGKRLIKQKKFQLNLLENNLKENALSLTDSDLSINENEDEDEEKLFSFKNNTNLNDLIQSLKKSQTKSQLKGLYEQKIHPILKKIPKLNNNLEMMFENINSSLIDGIGYNKELHSYKNLKNFNDDSSFIDEKWRKYLGENQNSNKKINYFQSTIDADSLGLFQNQKTIMNKKINSFDTSKIINGPWENTPAYHKLTLESGTRLLEEKWNKYMGKQLNTTPNNNMNFAKTLNIIPSIRSISNFDNRFSNTTTITIPEQTKQRLKSHIDWLKKFKADGADTNFLNNN